MGHSIKFHNYPFIVFGLILLLKVANVTPNYPDETGGYSITVAFNEDIVEPVPIGAISLLIENIKTTIGSFSEKLWNASRHQFYIKSVDLLIPSSWNGVNASHSINHSYDVAAIRITTSGRVYADNPFTCGKPGNFIELPLSFFNTSDSGRYGPNWKVMLNLWASYRWGIYEEHGYIGDLKYPYSHKDLLTDEWHVTGCSDQQISGLYRNNESVQCSASDTLEEGSTCRFIPDESTNATTSIMHFHWINSIMNFCDESNHDKLSPNRHNALCDHKSAWEVIKITRDYQIVTNPISGPIPPVVFKIVRHSQKPSLYILLDKGSIQGSIGLAHQIPRAVVNFLSDPERYDTITALGTFPSLNGNGDPINDEIEWSTLGDNLNTFIDVIGTLRLNGPLQRNFPQAILAAANKIKAKAHPNGVVMLVVKYGADLSSFVNYPAESEVIQALNDQGIILNTIELAIANHTGHAHLSELAQKTGGTYTVVSNYGDAQTSLSTLFWFMNKILNDNFKERRKTYRTLLKSSVSPGSVVRFKVPKPLDQQNNPGKVEAYFSTNDGSLSVNSFVIEGIGPAPIPSVAVIDSVIRKRQDWFETGSKWTYFFGFAIANIASYSEVTIRVNCLTCHGIILVMSDVVDDATKDVTISVSTNIEGNSIDLSRNEPITILAKITKSDAPVIGAQVLAFITDASGTSTTTIRLADNGNGNPDEDVFDGTYSGYFVPNRDGNYKISISVQGNSGDRATFPLLTLENAITHKHERLLPIDQDMGCSGASCDKAVLSGDFMQSIDIFTNLEVSGTTNYSPEPTKINTFIVNPDTDVDSITLLWIAPAVPGRLFSVSSYDIRHSTSKENLITDFQSQGQVPGTSTIIPRAPGSIETLKVAKPSVTTFYAIRSEYRGQQSKIANIQAIQIRESTSSPTPPSSTISPSTFPSSGSTISLPPPTTSTTFETSTQTALTSSSTTSAQTESTSSSTTSTEIASTSLSTTSTQTEFTSPSITSAQTGLSSSSSTTSIGTTGGGTITETFSDSSVPPSSEITSSTTNVSPTSTKKPWAKTGGGIAVITIISLIIVSAIIFVIFYCWQMRISSTWKINPPPKKLRSSILL